MQFLHRRLNISRRPYWRIHIHSMSSQISATGMPAVPSSIEDKFDAKQPVDMAAYSSRWESIWAAGLQKGQRFDGGESSPALLDLISSRRLDVRHKRVVVPGCGRGYDVAAFTTAGACEVVGLELSSTAVQEAQSYLRESLMEEDVRIRAVVKEGDFFSFSEEFDVGYDYTFGCAMHPDQRRDWAATWARLIKPGGLLATLIFPVDPSRDPDIGPPFPLTADLYRQLLVPAGFVEISVDPVPEQLSHKGRGGFEHMGIWRRAG